MKCIAAWAAEGIMNIKYKKTFNRVIKEKIHNMRRTLGI